MKLMKITNRNLPHVLSWAIVVAVILWMATGLGRDPEASSIETTATGALANTIQQVRVQQFNATEITREILVSGRTDPNRTVEVRAETDGTVVSISAERGEVIKEDSLLLTLDIRDRNSQLNEAAALVAQRELELKAIENLLGRKFTTEVEIADAKAQLESARASYEKIQLEISNTRINSPFDAVLQERSVEIGDFVRTGDAVAELVDLDPLIVSGEVNEREVAELIVGSQGTTKLVDGTELAGIIRYLAPVADPNTRSFKVELAVPNPDNAVRAGQTAEMRLYADRIRVHTLSAALLTLADDGTVGVKVVDNNDEARFYPVEIVGSSPGGMQVTGLPDAIRLITVGQGFVTEGQKVNPVMVSSPESAATYERAD
jgi:membrane fusion protein, multidrug efflux system